MTTNTDATLTINEAMASSPVVGAEILELKQRLASIPNELSDNIYDYVLSPDTEVVNITQDYKPPVQLQLSRATRETAALNYYSNTTFQVEEGYEGLLVDVWLPSITAAHKAHIRKIFLKRVLEPGRSWNTAVNIAWKDLDPLWVLSGGLANSYYILPRNFCTNIVYDDDYGDTKEVVMDGKAIEKVWMDNGMGIVINLGPGFKINGPDAKYPVKSDYDYGFSDEEESDYEGLTDRQIYLGKWAGKSLNHTKKADKTEQAKLDGEVEGSKKSKKKKNKGKKTNRIKGKWGESRKAASKKVQHSGGEEDEDGDVGPAVDTRFASSNAFAALMG